MRVHVYSARSFERNSLSRALSKAGHLCVLSTAALNIETTHLAAGFDAVCIFSRDDASAAVIRKLSEEGVRYITLK